jgi:hypothetical protein
MFFMRVLFTFLFCGIGFYLSAQTPFLIEGKVLDEKGNALVGASVLNRSNSTGTVTTQSGSFSLSIPTLPAYVEVSFIGYRTYYVSLGTSDFDASKKVSLKVQLEPLTEELAPATVIGSNYQDFFTHPGFEVLDFTLIDEHTLLLLRHERKYKLVLMNEAEDSLAFLPLNRVVNGFVTDCLRQRYLLTKDSVLALSFADNQIQLLGGVDLEFYNQRVRPCIASNTHSLYYNFYQFNNQLLEIYQSSKAGGESRKIKELVDREDALSIDEYGKGAKALMESTSPVGEINLQELGGFKEGFDRMAWFSQVLAKPIYNPLFGDGEGAVLFNHLRDSVQCLDRSGGITASFPIVYHKRKDFRKLLIQDSYNQSLYVVFESGGIWSLAKLSKQDYTLGEAVPIQGHDFPVSLKIRGGIAYFLDYDPKDLSRLKLYRQRLSGNSSF